MIDQALIIRMALHFFWWIFFPRRPPEVACAWKSGEWTWNLPGGMSFELSDVPHWLGPQTFGQLFFHVFSAEQISNHGRILNGRMHVYIIYTCLSLMNPDQCFDVSVRLKSNGKTELAEVWERLLTWAQDPGNDDEGVSSWCHGIVDVATAVDQIC